MKLSFLLNTYIIITLFYKWVFFRKKYIKKMGRQKNWQRNASDASAKKMAKERLWRHSQKKWLKEVASHGAKAMTPMRERGVAGACRRNRSTGYGYGNRAHGIWKSAYPRFLKILGNLWLRKRSINGKYNNRKYNVDTVTSGNTRLLGGGPPVFLAKSRYLL